MSRTVLSQEQIESLPTGRSYQSLSATIPALSPSGSGRFDVGGASQMWQGTVVAYGSLANDTALEVDGMSVMTLLNQGSIAGVYHNQGAYQEMSYQVVAGHGRIADRRRAHQHDSEGRRQPLLRRRSSACIRTSTCGATTTTRT